jgi:hypothetical protein
MRDKNFSESNVAGRPLMCLTGRLWLASRALPWPAIIQLRSIVCASILSISVLESAKLSVVSVTDYGVHSSGAGKT